MPRLCSSYLLGVWLLLSQLPRDISGENPDDIVKACGRELVRRRIQICGSINWKKKPVSLQEPGLDAGAPAEIMASSVTKDAEALNTMLEFTPNLPQELKATLSERQPSLRELQRPALKDSDLNFEEFKEILLNRPSVAEDNSL
ncbi:prorelaxin-like [Diceros bicornis minor]|uniref:prorelaxin-like n=1 Tax=Diceros bicornis minor TaxID=77932 RepID=UPI0026EDA587|nr:prorelaxin-like [Diceros bicornis minor]